MEFIRKSKPFAQKLIINEEADKIACLYNDNSVVVFDINTMEEIGHTNGIVDLFTFYENNIIYSTGEHYAIPYHHTIFNIWNFESDVTEFYKEFAYQECHIRSIHESKDYVIVTDTNGIYVLDINADTIFEFETYFDYSCFNTKIYGNYLYMVYDGDVIKIDMTQKELMDLSCDSFKEGQNNISSITEKYTVMYYKNEIVLCSNNEVYLHKSTSVDNYKDFLDDPTDEKYKFSDKIFIYIESKIGVSALCISKDEKYIIVGFENGEITIHDICEKMKNVCTIKGESKIINIVSKNDCFIVLTENGKINKHYFLEKIIP